MPDTLTQASGPRVAPLAAVNDFVVKFANVNGSGSASANGLFAKSIIRMGVPVAARNIFPSNIQGLPTWYEVRVTEKGYLGRRGGVDMMVAMNPQTWDADVRELEPGGYLFYDSTKPMPKLRARTAILMPVHNEDATAVFARLRAMDASLAETGASRAFDIFILSDTRDAAVALAEQPCFARFRREATTPETAKALAAVTQFDQIHGTLGLPIYASEFCGIQHSCGPIGVGTAKYAAVGIATMPRNLRVCRSSALKAMIASCTACKVASASAPLAAI